MSDFEPKHHNLLRYSVARVACKELIEKLIKCEIDENEDYYTKTGENGTNAADEPNPEDALPPFNLNSLPENIDGDEITVEDKNKRIKQIETLQSWLEKEIINICSHFPSSGFKRGVTKLWFCDNSFEDPPHIIPYDVKKYFRYNNYTGPFMYEGVEEKDGKKYIKISMRPGEGRVIASRPIGDEKIFVQLNNENDNIIMYTSEYITQNFHIHDQLPEGWDRDFTEDGMAYYWHESWPEERTQWVHPANANFAKAKGLVGGGIRKRKTRRLKNRKGKRSRGRKRR